MHEQLQAGTEGSLLDGVTHNIEAQVDNLNGLTQAVRQFCDAIMGPAPSPPPTQPPGAANVVQPDTRGSKLIRSTDRLALATKDLGDQILRLRRI